MSVTATADRGAEVSPLAGDTLPAILLSHAEATPDRVALRQKELGRWRRITWAEYAERASLLGLGLRALGVEAGDKVAIHSENRVEWLLADMGIQGIGAIAVGVYPTSPAAEVGYVLGHSESVVLFAEDEEQLDKALEVRKDLPNLRKIVVTDMRGVEAPEEDLVMSLADLEALGAAEERATYDRLVAELDPEDVAVIVYTSGTTGPPKGAMLAHRNLLAAAASSAVAYDVGEDDEVLSYLPLCHVAERLISVINAIASGYIVNFGEGPATFATDIQEVQPTFFLGVPRVWERMLASVEIRVADASWLKRLVYRTWTGIGVGLARRRWEGRFGLWSRLVYLVGWLVLYRSIRVKLGLARVKGALSGAAPIAPQVLEYFWALGVPVREGYGMTENTAQATVTPEDDVRLGTVGVALPGAEVTIARDGEILTRGPGTFVGYFKDEGATRETIDVDGWLHTGDIGEIDDDGFLTITDRKKDIIITPGGKNISPAEIENKIKVSPFVREAIVIGDQRKYLVALIGIEGDTVGDWVSRQGVAYTTYEDLSAQPEVRQLVQSWIDEVNEDLAQVETVKRFELLPKELDQEEGELTATQKVKRAQISDQFGQLIDAMY